MPLDCPRVIRFSPEAAWGTLSIESRRDLNRLVGLRHDVRMELRGSLVASESGRYRFELDCDDRCGLRIDGSRLTRASGLASIETSLEEGRHAFSILFDQRQGPAHLRVRWKRPALLELLPMDHFVSARVDGLTLEDVRGREARAALSFLGSFAWWFAVLALVVGVGEARRSWQLLLTTGRGGRWAPVGAATLFILFGVLLRVDAFARQSTASGCEPGGRRGPRTIAPRGSRLSSFLSPELPPESLSGRRPELSRSGGPR